MPFRIPVALGAVVARQEEHCQTCRSDFSAASHTSFYLSGTSVLLTVATQSRHDELEEMEALSHPTKPVPYEVKHVRIVETTVTGTVFLGLASCHDYKNYNCSSALSDC